MSVKSPFGDVEVPEIPLTTAVYMRFASYGDKVALVDGITGKQFTFNELIDITHRVASGLAKLGLKKGEVVSLYSANSVEWVFMFWGVLCAGGTVTTVNPAYTKYELKHHLKDSGAKYLYTQKELLGNATSASREVPSIKKIVCPNVNSSDCVPFEQLMNDDASKWPELEELEFNPKEDVVVIPYSSGTTGLPKGVMLTHYNILANMLQMGHPNFADPVRIKAIEEGTWEDRVLVVLPFYHAFGLIGILCMASASSCLLVILPRFEPRSFLHAIEKFKVTNLPIVPPIVIFLAKSPLVKEYDLSSVKRAVSGAAPLSKEVERDFTKRMDVPEMRQGFGMTETTLAAISHSPQKTSLPGSCGMLLPGSEAKIVDVSSGKVVGPNQRGELWFRGPQVMKGYLNNPKATRETIDKEGFLHTGDIAYYDASHYFFIVDRMKELIKVKGFQVAPAELEALLLNHPKVADVGVTGIPDERAGEVPRAYVVRRPGVQLDAREINQYVEERTAPYKHLKGGVQFINEIPRLQSGKIIRRKLKELATKSKI